jgi:hypothetical protein
MFHGTRSQNLIKILKDRIRPVGNGALGKGFYMTPILEKALNYTVKQQQLDSSKTFPVIIEIFVPRPNLLKVCCLDRSNELSCCHDGDLYTDYDILWQFLVKDQKLLDLFHYNVWII